MDFEHLIFERIQIFPLSIWKSEHQQTALRTLEFKTSANSSARQLRSTAIPALGELRSQSVKYSSSIRSNIFYRTVLVTDTVVFTAHFLRDRHCRNAGETTEGQSGLETYSVTQPVRFKPRHGLGQTHFSLHTPECLPGMNFM